MEKLAWFLLPDGGKAWFGHQLDLLWAREDSQLHYFQYQPQNKRMQLAWKKPLPEGQQWYRPKYVTDQQVIMQSSIFEVCYYDKEKLQLVKKIPSPGWICGIIDMKFAVVRDHVTVQKDGLHVHLASIDDLQPHHSLQTPADKMYSKNDWLTACGQPDGRVAVVEAEKRILDLYRADGSFANRVQVQAGDGHPSCTDKHVLVVLKFKPVIQVFSWTGQFLQFLGPTELGLQPEDVGDSLSPVHEGSINFWVITSDSKHQVQRYKIKKLKDATHL